MKFNRICLFSIAVAVALTAAFSSPAFAQKEPIIQQVEPVSGPPGTTVDIMGRRFIGDIEVRLGKTPLTVERSLPNRITVRIPPGAKTGRITVKTSGGEIAGIEFRVDAPLPVPEISEFTPTEGPPGTEVVVLGSNFDSRLTRNSVLIGDMPVVVRYASPMKLQVIVPESATTGRVKVEVASAGSAESKTEFKVTAATKIFDFQPRRGAPGTEVTISGSGFSTHQSDNRVYLNNVAAKVVSATESLLTVKIPKKASSGPLLVDVRGAGRADTKLQSFAVQYPPTVVGFAPEAAPPGGLVVLRGTNFGTNATAIEVRLGELPLRVREVSDIRLQVAIPEGAASGKFSVKVNGMGPALSSGTLDVLPPLRIESFSPRSGPAGSTFTIKGTGFSTVPARNVVTLANRPLQVVSALSTELLVRVSPGPSGLISVRVQRSGETQSSDPFLVTFPPAITGFEPKKASVGEAVKIRGTGFGLAAGAVKVRVGNQSLEVLSIRDDLLVVRLTPGSRTGPISVTVPLQGSGHSRTDLKVIQPEKAVPLVAVPPPKETPAK